MSAPARGSLALLLALALTGTSRLDGQRIPASQRGTVTQRIAGAELTIVYDRPVARGRELFGAIVPWGRPWTPGANRATYLETTRDLRVAGADLPAGKYSIWTIPEPGEWTIIFSLAWDVFHLPYPEGRDALRVSVSAETGPHMETLAFYFPSVDGRSAVLALHWGETVVSVPIEVPSGGER